MKVRLVLQQICRGFSLRRCVSVNSARQISFFDRSKTNDWKQAVSEAEKIVGYPTSFMSLRCLLSDELANVAIQMRKLVGTKHPLLKTARGFLLDNGKHSLQTRGLIVLLIAKAAGAPEGSFDQHEMVSGIYPSQRQLAEITEMIHTANLIHRGVINLDTLQETDGSYKDMEFGNKIAVLSGDFLLTSASTGLAELNNTLVVEMISRAIGDMMSAEFTQLRDRNGNTLLPEGVSFADWERQTFLQSGSLLSRSCEAVIELAGHEDHIKHAASKFGENVAYARQMHEDLLPFMNLNLEANGIMSSAPLIKYAEICGHSCIQQDKTSNQIIESVQKKSEVIDWCKQKCGDYGQLALDSLKYFKPSDAKDALIKIVNATTYYKSSKS